MSDTSRKTRPSRYPVTSMQVVYENKHYRIEHERISRHGVERDFYIMSRDPSGVFVIGLQDEKILMIREYRQHIHESVWELPAGSSNPGESIVETARRELQEETGFITGRCSVIGKFYSDPGVSDMQYFVVLAQDLEKSEQHLESDEDIEECRLTPIPQIQRLIREGTIADGPSVAALAYYLCSLPHG